MKKVFSLLICLLLCFSLCTAAFANDYKISLTPSKKTLSVGESVTINISVSGDITAESAAFYVETSEGLTVKSGEITRKDAKLKAFDSSNNRGVSAYENPVALEGDFAKVKVTANNKAKGKQTVDIGVIANPGNVTIKNSLSFDFSESAAIAVSSGDNNLNENNSSDNSSEISSKNSSETNTDPGDTQTIGETKNKPNISDNTSDNTNDNTNKLIIIFSVIAAVVIAASVVTVTIKKK